MLVSIPLVVDSITFAFALPQKRGTPGAVRCADAFLSERLISYEIFLLTALF